MSFVTDEFRPSFSSVRVISICAPSSEERRDAARRTRPGIGAREDSRSGPPNAAFVIHCFVPRTCQPSSVASADVTSAPASDPAPGLGEREAADPSPRASGGTKRAICVVGAERENRQRARGRVHGDGDADAGVGARELLEHEDVRHEVGAAPAVLLRHADAEQPELAEPVEQLAREAVRAIPLGGVRLDLGGGELARERLDLALLRASARSPRAADYPDESAAAILASSHVLAACGGHAARFAGGRSHARGAPR